MSAEFRVPLPEKIGPGMSSTILNFKPPRSKQFNDEKLVEISERLMELVGQVSLS
jgi:hypothetical protein